MLAWKSAFRVFRTLSTYSLIAGTLATVLYVLETAWATGELRSIEPHFLGKCTAIQGVTGAEDVTIHPRTGIAYISAYDRAAEARGMLVRGAIYAYQPGSLEVPIDLTRDVPVELRPHGISVVMADPKSGTRDTLFAVNHGPSGHSVEVFDIEPKRLVHRRSVRDATIVSPSDVLGVGRESFYVTNDSGTQSGTWGWWLENLLRFPYSNVVYHDGQRFFVVADHIAKANGIALDAKRNHIYVSALMSRTVHVYDRDEATGVMVERTRIALGTNPDGLEIDSEGSVWVGAHPRLITLMRHLVFGTEEDSPSPPGAVWNPSIHAPSQVLRIKPEGGGQYQLSEIYADDGKQIMASSVGARHGERLMIGSLTDTHFLDCKLDPHPLLDYNEAGEKRDQSRKK